MKHPAYAAYRRSGVEWLEDVPEHWQILKFSREIRIAEGQVDPEVEPFASMGLIAPNHIESGTGRLLAQETAVDQGAESGKYMCRGGDVVYSKIRPGLAKVAIAPQDCLCSADMYPLSGNARVTNRYLYWLLLSKPFTAWSVLESDRVAMPKINRETLGELRIPVPPPSEQDDIAAYLDDKVATTTMLVEKKQALIEKLKEKRAALISRTVTRGLPPDAARAAGLDPHPTLKPSGIDWLGQMPAHWRATQLKYAASTIVDCPHETPTYSSDGDYAVVRTADIASGVLDLSAAYLVDEDEYRKRIRRQPLLEGDIVYGREGERWGFAALVPSNPKVCLGQRMMQFRAAPHFDSRFLMWQLNASCVYNQGAVDTAGATAPHVNVLTIRNYWLTEPPLGEQRVIAEYLESETARIDHLVARIDAAIKRLQEYRIALIVAAVTGKIDVRAWRGESTPVPAEAKLSA